jgi:NitT/TauT family transport system permease protein
MGDVVALQQLSVGKTDAELFETFYERETTGDAVRKRRIASINLAGRMLILGAFVGAWWLVSAFYPPVLVPSPFDTWRALLEDRSTIWGHTPATIIEIVLGFLAGSVLGIGLGALIAQSRWAEVTLRPYLVISQAVPKIALAPILLIFFGFGIGPKVLISALIAFFPLLENTITGLRRVDPDSLRLFQSLGASKWQIFVKLRVFSALPMVFAGLRIAAILATLGAIVAEFVAGNKGLGALLVISLGTFSTPLMYATMTVLTVLAFVVYVITQWLERKALKHYNLIPPSE